MPRPAKGAAAKKPPGDAKKSKKLYSMPEKIPEGTVVTDMQKQSWRVGASIGSGGFGEIYIACKVGENKYDYVLKCEPHENGPLFVEKHFYLRCGKQSDLSAYQKKKGLKSFGMPYIASHGSVMLNNINHRFIVIPRFGRNIQHYYDANGGRLPVSTAYRLAIQMLDVYEYVHECGYVHADLKASNILLGYGKNANAQAYLVDYGLASRYFGDRDFKPDPKKAHNGTIEYTSRDAHQGVPSVRADLEILGYNLVNWLGAPLPWVRDKLLGNPVQVHAAKVVFMTNLETELRKIFPQGVPAPLLEFMKYVAKQEYNAKPDYKKCRKIFQDALKQLKASETGDLELEIKKSSRKESPPAKRAAKEKRAAVVAVESDEDDDQGQRNASDDDDDDVIFESPRQKVGRRGLAGTNVKRNADNTNTPSGASPRKRTSPKAASAISPTRKKVKTSPPGKSTPTPLTAKANIKVSPAISLPSKASSAARSGSTVVNDSTTPRPNAKKTYEFNFELDVSVDANVIVNVKRKKKPPAATTTSSSALKSSSLSNGSNDSPVTRVRVQKITSDGNQASPRTPAVTVKKSKRIVSPR